MDLCEGMDTTAMCENRQDRDAAKQNPGVSNAIVGTAAAACSES